MSQTASHTAIAATMTSPTLNHNGMPGELSYSDAIASACLLDDLLAEPTELVTQRVEIPAQGREHDSVDAVVGEPTDAVKVHHSARRHLDCVRVAAGVL